MKPESTANAPLEVMVAERRNTAKAFAELGTNLMTMA